MLTRRVFFVITAIAIGLIGLRANAQGPIAVDLSTPDARQQTVERLRLEAEAEKAEALEFARTHGLVIRGTTSEGATAELMRIVDGRPQYYTTGNANAAISTGVDQIRNVGPYNLNGAGLNVGVWDLGSALSTHQELIGRVTSLDGAPVDFHATHVTGTIAGAGVLAAAMGMAPSVAVRSYDWNNDAAEVAAEAAAAPGTGIYISNHSYGLLTGWEGDTWYGVWGADEDENFGIYSSLTQLYDNICYNAPYFLAFKAAMNNRNQVAPSTGASFTYWDNGWQMGTYDPSIHPLGDGIPDAGYDTVTAVGNAKNIMTVGAVNDAVLSGSRNVAFATMSTFSGWGPSDDGRIKPDIVANGVSVLSAEVFSNSAYIALSGTSMATPNAAGSAILLHEYYGELFPGETMRASTLKALIIHTADDLGRPGPDYSNGWGLMNAKEAADVLMNHEQSPRKYFVIEDSLTDTDTTDSLEFVWDGVNSIRATLCWWDPPGAARFGLDNPGSNLTNNLDLVVVGPGGSPVYRPFTLDPANPTDNADTGKNTRDTVEQVLIDTPMIAGVYTVRVKHNQTLVNGPQHYSLIVTGSNGTVPENDDFVKAARLSKTDPEADGFNENASKEVDERKHAGTGGASVWYKWRAPFDGTAMAWTSDSNFDPVLAAYRGNDLPNLVRVGQDDNSGSGSNPLVNFTLKEGKMYRIAVDGAGAATGEFHLTVAPIPKNDNFSDAIRLPGVGDNVKGSNLNTTRESGEPGHGGPGATSVWWKWKAPSDGNVTIHTNGSDFDTLLGVYRGSDVSNLTKIATDNNSGIGKASAVSFDVKRGKMYRIAVAGYRGATGAIKLTLERN